MSARPKGCGESSIDGCSARECHLPYCKRPDYDFATARAQLKADRAAELTAWLRSRG